MAEQLVGEPKTQLAYAQANAENSGSTADYGDLWITRSNETIQRFVNDKWAHTTYATCAQL